MKISWGTGLAIWLVIFVLSILTFVAFAFAQDVNLVHEEYYQKGVDFDNERNKRERGLAEENQFTIEQNREQVTVSINKDFFLLLKDVELYFYRPSDRHQDKRISFESESISILKSELIKGRYTLNMSWQKDGKEFLLEKYLYIKK